MAKTHLVLYTCAILGSIVASSAVDLFTALSKKDLQLYIKALEIADAAESVNEPDKKGRFALIESVKLRKKEFVEMTLEYGGKTSVVEGGTGKTVLHYAFANNDVAIAQVLLAWGADPDAEDKSGTVARDVAKKSKDMTALLSILDVEGPVAFEDPPGTWRKGYDEEHKLSYYHNQNTGKSVWRQPPSCAWNPAQLEDSTIYANAVTHQTLWHLPKALAWRQVTKGNETFWFNYRTNATQVEAPAELPASMLGGPTTTGNHYWHNSVTGESAWEEPKVSEWSKLTDPEGRTFYFHAMTGESSWDPPAELAWREAHSEEHDRPYWYNEKTKESQWTKPDLLSWTRVNVKDEL